MDDGVQLSEDLPEFGVEVVLDAIIGPASLEVYFPGIFWAITDHLLPISL